MEPRPEIPQIAQIYQRLGELLALAGAHFRWQVLPAFEVAFDLRGKAAGQMVAGRSGVRLRFNPVLLRQNWEDFLHTVVAHELAHAVVWWQYGRRAKPHGPEWQAVMRLFGLEPQRCHDYDVAGGQARRLQRFRYRCGCREHALTSIRHGRIQRGEREYVCKFCGQRLEWTGA
ncbi:hypothetical protein MIN45_P0448 [Methylomarinovum tepidoasis]|uniref:SprT-like domain-containing protein n=1 Tax=Methylomarinovum tepidoasis TaxID=2840183 RepID=A0AAU9CBK4_9GAMM|nr:SprT-like domain-containing protein [Methylomarinovum sp. IN45]BCX88081.1 hypothetical protein MIN45_P0448 [Methylomarinovum sp. IN45]